jgi:hypothetical protein
VPYPHRRRYRPTTLDPNAAKLERVRAYFEANADAPRQSNHFIAALINVGERMIRRYRDANGIPQLAPSTGLPREEEPPPKRKKRRK